MIINVALLNETLLVAMLIMLFILAAVVAESVKAVISGVEIRERSIYLQ